MKIPAVLSRPMMAGVLASAALIIASALWIDRSPSRVITLDAAKSTTAKNALANAAQFSRLSHMPLTFEANVGQADTRVQYLAHTVGYAFMVTDDGPMLVLRDRAPSSGMTRTAKALAYFKRWLNGPGNDAHQVSLQFVDSNAKVQWHALESLPGRSNYFVGNDPQHWHRDIAQYGRLWGENLYQGIDLTFYGQGGNLEYDFRVAPGADVGQIRMQARELSAPQINSDGDALWRVGAQLLRLQRPVAYQEIAGKHRAVDAQFVLRDGALGFNVGAYDAAYPLVIDPVLSYSAFVGGNDSTTYGLDMAVDVSGNAYLVGTTCTAAFPATGGSVGTQGGGSFAQDFCEDAFVTKFSADGSTLLYSTFLHGANSDAISQIALDSTGAAYVTGLTESTDFPTTAGAYSTSARGGDCPLVFVTIPCADAFVTKLSPDGSQLLYSTYLGGSRMDLGFAIAIDNTGAAYIGGWTNSNNLPTVSAAQSNYGGDGTCYASHVPCYDAFVAKLNPSGSALVYATYLGGSDQDVAIGIGVDSSGTAYVSGATASSNFPTTSGAYRTAHTSGSQEDIFVTRLNASGSVMSYSTLIGGTSTDWPLGLYLDGSGNVYLAGQTTSTDFPVTNGAYQTTYAGANRTSCSFGLDLTLCGDAFVLKLNSSGTGLGFATYVGGTYDDGARAVTLDASGNIWITGGTFSNNFPTTSDAFYGAGSYTGFVAELNANASQLLYSSALQTSGNNAIGTAVVTDDSNGFYVAGVAGGGQQDFATTPNAYSTGGSSGAFVAHYVAGAVPAVQLSPSTLDFGNQNIDNTSPSQAVTLTNTGAGVLRPAVSITGSAAAAAAFLQSNNCAATLNAGQSCTISVSTQPSSNVYANAKLTVLDNAPGSPHTVALSSIGIDARAAAFVPAVLDFGWQAAGVASTSPFQQLSSSFVVQTMDAYPRIRSVVVGGVNAADFQIDLSGCAAGSFFCGLSAQFRPQTGATGTRTATVTLASDIYGSPYVLTLTGQVATGAALAFSPAALDFENVASSGITQYFNVTNRGGTTLTITAIAPPSSEFSVVTGTCGALPISIAAQVQCNIGLRFQPTTTGRKDGVLTFTSNSVNSPHSYPVFGTGITAGGPQLRLSTRSVDLGTLQVGTNMDVVPAFITVSNFGTASVSISSITTSGDFSLVARSGTGCGSALAAGSSCTLALGFTPSVVGVRSGILTINSNAPGSPHTVSLSGIGVLVPLPKTSINALSFGNIGVGVTSPPQSVTIQNNGNAALPITSIAATGPFSVSNTCGAQLAAGASCVVTVQTTPTATGPATGLVTILDGSASGRRSVALSVNGIVGAAVQMSPSVLDFGNQAVNTTSSARNITVTSTGTISIGLGQISINGDFIKSSNCPTTLSSGASCTVQVSFNPSLVTDPIALDGNVAITGSFTGSPLLATLKGIGTSSASGSPNFSISATPTALTVANGQSGTVNVAVSPLNGSTQTVSLNCSGLPANASCSFAPSSITLNGSQTQNMVVTVHSSVVIASLVQHISVSLAIMSGPGGVLLILMMAGQPQRRRTLALSVSIVLALFMLASCGGGSSSNGGSSMANSSASNSSSSSAASGVTPSGTYNIQVNATSGSISHATTIVLTVP